MNWFNTEANTKLAQNGQRIGVDKVMSIQITSSYENGDDRYYRYTAFRGFDVAAMTTKMEEPERFVQLLDWAMSPEGQVMLGWGIEGDHYTVDFTKALERQHKLCWMDIKMLTSICTKKESTCSVFLGCLPDVDENGQNYTMTQDASFIMSSFTDTQKRSWMLMDG